MLAFDDQAADHCSDVLVARERAGLPMSTADAQTAPICRASRAVCATRNTKDFTFWTMTTIKVSVELRDRINRDARGGV